MSIEKDLSRIATALEQIQKTLQQNINPVFTVGGGNEVAPVPVQQAPTAPTAPPSLVGASTAPAAPTAPPSLVGASTAPAVVTKEDLNLLCKKIYTDLGTGDGIMAILAEFGVNGIAELPEARHAEFHQKLTTLVA